jgi:hypothetical protein
VEPVADVHRLRRLGATAALALLAACSSGGPHRDDAAVVKSVLDALASGDIAPVAGAFTPEARAQLDDRVHVGILSRELIPLGALDHVEPLPHPSPGAIERFSAVYAHGKRTVDVNFDDSGKIVAFWVHDRM